MVRQRIPRHIELKRRGKLTRLPKRFRPLLVVLGIAAVLIIYLDKQSNKEIVDSRKPSHETNVQPK
jgi:hypothetical protein